MLKLVAAAVALVAAIYVTETQAGWEVVKNPKGYGGKRCATITTVVNDVTCCKINNTNNLIPCSNCVLHVQMMCMMPQQCCV